MVEPATLTIIAHHLHQRALTKHENCRPRDRAKSARERVLPRPTRSQPLPKPLVIPSAMTRRTPAEVSELMRHLPEENRNKSTWRYVAAQLDGAANETIDTIDVEIALRLVLMLEGVRCQPR